ncbi:MAG: hypothetical protein HOI47_07975 [Candidatus Scalindua sp.]|jgi:hypothetical protein|nr:hypothetical protein [Candidatus Scalindua sp.]
MRTNEELRQLSQKRRKEIADSVATIHKILSGRYNPGEENKQGLKIKALPHGKFFTAPTPGVDPQVEAPALYEKTQDIIPTEDWRNLYDPDIDPRAP